MSAKYSLKDEEIVVFDNGNLKGVGSVIGVASEPIFGLGVTYIVLVHRCNVEIPNSEYPYKAIALAECFLTKKDPGLASVH